MPRFRTHWLKVIGKNPAYSVAAAGLVLASAGACPAQEWMEAPIDQSMRVDFEAIEPQTPNLYLLPLEVGPAQRFDFTGNAPYETPERLDAATVISRFNGEPASDTAPKPANPSKETKRP